MLREPIHIDPVLDVLPKVEPRRSGVKEVEHLLIVDLKERAPTQELY